MVALMFRGTAVEAIIAAAVTLLISNVDLLAGILFVFAILEFSSRGVNTGLAQILSFRS